MKKALLLTTIILCCGCNYKPGTAEREQQATEENQDVLLKTQPPVRLTWSLERDNLNRRTKLWNDQNKVSYIYLVNYGRIMAFYTIKGKVSSVNSQVTNPDQLAIARRETFGGRTTISGVLPSPAEDGSYGTNGDAIFFFTTDGTYVEWRGDYMLCDKPLKLSTPPVMVINASE